MKTKIIFLLFILSSCLYGQGNKFTVSGVVTDCQTKGLIMDVAIKLVGNDGSSIETMTDISGYYYFDSKKVNANTEYVITAYVTGNAKVVGSKNTRGYLSSSDKCKFNTHDTTGKTFTFNFCLVKGGCVMRLPCARFEKNNSLNYTIDEDSFDLDVLYQFMLDNPNLVLEIGGHASKDEKAPKALAEKRAKMLKEILVKKGVESDRLVVNSYADTKPYETVDEDTMEITIADKNNEASYKMNRRVIMNVIRKDYISKNPPQEQPKNNTEIEEGE